MTLQQSTRVCFCRDLWKSFRKAKECIERLAEVSIKGSGLTLKSPPKTNLPSRKSVKLSMTVSVYK